MELMWMAKLYQHNDIFYNRKIKKNSKKYYSGTQIRRSAEPFEALKSSVFYPMAKHPKNGSG